jgi:hypothetical protein
MVRNKTTLLNQDDDSGVFFGSTWLTYNYMDRFRYTQHIVTRGSISDDMAIFIISHCSCLLLIGIVDYDQYDPIVTDHTLQWTTSITISQLL